MKRMAHLKFFVVVLFGFISLSVHSQLPEVKASYKLVTDAVLVPLDSVASEDAEYILGDLAVLRLKQYSKMDISGLIGANKAAVDSLLIEDQYGNYGTSDGTLLVMVREKGQLRVLAADYGLTIKHLFESGTIGQLEPPDTENAFDWISNLEADRRVTMVELNTNFYREKPN